MKALVTVLLLSMAVVTPVLADYDAALEAREQAQREAEARAEAARQRENQRLKAAAQAKFDTGVMAEKRKSLGAAAKGKSDAEVSAMFDAKIARDSQNATRTAADIQKKTQASVGSGDGAKALKDMTGKSLADMQNMSDAELEVLGADMERKYGGK